LRCGTRSAIKISTWTVSELLTGINQRVTKMKRHRKDTTKNEDQLFALEEHLAGTLKPITPPSELVVRMRDRIRMPQRQEIVSRIGDWQRLLLVFGGVMSGFVVLVTIARAFFYFLGRK
jgi:hypothetical protein